MLSPTGSRATDWFEGTPRSDRPGIAKNRLTVAGIRRADGIVGWDSDSLAQTSSTMTATMTAKGSTLAPDEHVVEPPASAMVGYPAQAAATP